MKALLVSILAALLFGVLLGALLTCPGKATTQTAPQPGQHQAMGQASTTEGDTYRTQAQAFLKDLKAAKDKISTQDAEISRLKAAQPGILQQPTTGADPCPELRQLARRQDEQIQTQSQALGLCEQRSAALEGEATARGKAAESYRQEAEQFRLSAEPMRPRAIGLVYGTRGTAGVCAEMDIWRVRVGVDVVRQQTALGTSIEAMGRALWRF